MMVMPVVMVPVRIITPVWSVIPRIVIPWVPVPRVPPCAPGEGPCRSRKKCVSGIPCLLERVIGDGYRADGRVVEIYDRGFVFRYRDSIDLFVSEQIYFGAFRPFHQIIDLQVIGFRPGLSLLMAGIVYAIVESLDGGQCGCTAARRYCKYGRNHQV